MSPAPAFVGRANDVPSWESKIDSMLLFSDSRVAIARDQIENQFNLVKQVDVTLDVVPAGAGKIHISTITPESLPWTGVYFDGVPVTITATANPGYEFKYWEANSNLVSDQHTSSITLNIDTNDVFKAHFNILENDLSVYPNPFNNEITIKYQLESRAQVGIKLYTVIGQEVAEIVSPNTAQEAGSYTVTYDVNDPGLAQGVYFIELKTSEFSKVIKLVRSKVN
jgi:hypothetical protein